MMLRIDDHLGTWQAIEPGAPAPPFADVALPRVAVLAGLSVLSGAVSGSGDPPPVPTMTATLLRDAAPLVADPPLGARARVYDRAGVLVFDGRVRRVSAGADRVSLDLDSEIPL